MRFDVITGVKETVCKDACKGLPWCRPGVVEGVETPLAVAPRVGPRAARSSRGDGALRLVRGLVDVRKDFRDMSLKAFAA